MTKQISISSIASVSSLGMGSLDVAKAYQEKAHCFTPLTDGTLVAPLSARATQAIEVLKKEDARYRQLDPSVLYAIQASRLALAKSHWAANSFFGVNIGSSRGASSLFEKYHQQFLEQGDCPVKSSPRTTLGNIASWVSQDIQAKGPAISHSITCSTAMHALMNAVAWIKSGMMDKFVVGGSEAALTPFTIAQMRALNIYSQQTAEAYPSRPLDLGKTENTMILGEGAVVACLEAGVHSHSLAIVEGLGYATELIEHGASISQQALSIQAAMKMALKDTKLEEVDAIILHAPGTLKGDRAELNAIHAIFGEQTPFLTSNKWKTGHTFASSGLLSAEMAIIMMQTQKAIHIPYLKTTKQPRQINKVLLNSIGFGGNAVSVLLAKPT